MSHQVIKRDSLVVTRAGDYGRVSQIALLYQPGKPIKTGVRVYLLLEGRYEIFSPDEIRLRSNHDSDLLAFMALSEDNPKPDVFIDPEAVF